MFNKKTTNKGKKQKKTIDLDFLKLINSSVSLVDLKSAIQQLQNTNVLSCLENVFCSEVMEQIEMYNKIDVGTIVKGLRIEYVPDDVGGYPEEDYFNQVDEFIKKRKNALYECECEKAFDGVINDKITKEITSFVFERYSSIIDIPEEDVYMGLEQLKSEPKEEISSAIKIVDDLLGGLPTGLTTIAGSDAAKSMWALNIGYKAITNNSNVLYIALGCSCEQVYKRFLERHSCNKDKFDKEFSFEDLKSNYDTNNYNIIYNDFKNSCLSNLIIFDEKHFIISTHYNLQKLIVTAQQRFINNTGKGIDLVILDDFTFMKLDKGRQCITNQETIITEYFNYLRDQSKNLLGTKKKIPILVTIDLKQNYFDVNQLYTQTTPTIKKLSDNIFITYSDEVLKENNELKISVLQSFKGKTLEEEKSIKVNYKQWYIKYDETSGVSIQKKLEEQEERNKDLEKENDDIKRDFCEKFSPSKEETIEEKVENVDLNFE